MGFWNGTCMLSGLPIRYADPCAAMIIARRPENLDMTYPDSFFAPVTPVFLGNYDAYGAIENINDPDGAYEMLSGLDLRIQDEKSHTAGQKDGLEKLAKLTERGLVRLKLQNTSVPLYLALMHASLYHYAVRHANATRTVEALTGLMSSEWQSGRNLAEFKCPEKSRNLAALMKFMGDIRLHFTPMTGAGSQGELEHRGEARFYQEVADMAMEIHRSANH